MVVGSFRSARFLGIKVLMADQETLIPKKRGPKPTGQGTPVMVRLQPHQLEALDRWIEAQPEPRLTRPEALRRLADLGLANQ
jgi:hypothetical protein